MAIQLNKYWRGMPNGFSKNQHAGRYYTCLDCGRELMYHWEKPYDINYPCWFVGEDQSGLHVWLWHGYTDGTNVKWCDYTFEYNEREYTIHFAYDLINDQSYCETLIALAKYSYSRHNESINAKELQNCLDWMKSQIKDNLWKKKFPVSYNHGLVDVVGSTRLRLQNGVIRWEDIRILSGYGTLNEGDWVKVAEIIREGMRNVQKMHSEESLAEKEFEDNKREISVCPYCHGKLYTNDAKYNNEARWSDSKVDIDSEFEMNNFDIERIIKVQSEERYDKLYEDLDGRAAYVKNEICGDRINTPEQLKEYIYNLFVLESNIYSIGKHLRDDLYLQKHKKDVAFCQHTLIAEESIRDQLETSKDEYGKAQTELKHLQETPLAEVKVSKPIPPTKPSEPNLETPRFFNKKKVLAHNAELTALYQSACKKYESDFALYEQKLAECESQEKQLNRKAYEQHSQAVSEAEARVKRAKAIWEQNNSNIDAELKAVRSLPSVQLIEKEMTDKEIGQAEELLKGLIECRNKMYACNIIFDKYRNLVSLASFYEYLLAGRCSSLEGANGAYNIFETECRMNQIVRHLSDIVVSLEKIKDNQYLIYSRLGKIDGKLKAINSSMDKMSQSLADIKADTHDMNGYMETVAKNSRVIAYNSAVTAYYTAMNAELTNALGFMVALK